MFQQLMLVHSGTPPPPHHPASCLLSAKGHLTPTPNQSDPPPLPQPPSPKPARPFLYQQQSYSPSNPLCNPVALEPAESWATAPFSSGTGPVCAVYSIRTKTMGSRLWSNVQTKCTLSKIQRRTL